MYKIIYSIGVSPYFKEVEGERVHIHDAIHTFLHYNDDPNDYAPWTISEYLTGCRIADGVTRERAILNAQNVINERGSDRIIEGIQIQLSGENHRIALLSLVKSNQYAGLREWLTV